MNETVDPNGTHARAGARSTWMLIPGLLVCLALILWMARTALFSEPPLPVLGIVGGFELTNQTGRAFGSKDLEGKTWVANIIFTRCPGPCLQMTRRMSQLQQHFANNPSVQLISLTADPAFDTPTVLTRYGAKFQADPRQWNFLTGTKSNIVRVASDQLKLTAVEKDVGQRESIDDLFIHSTISVVVDRHGRIRSVVEVLETNGPALLQTSVARLVKER